MLEPLHRRNNLIDLCCWHRFVVCRGSRLHCGPNRKSLTIMAPKAPRVLQPPHLTIDDAWRVLADSYSQEDVSDLRADKTKLAFEYKKHIKGGDKDAMYKHRNVIKHFSKINNTDVWNWTVISGAVAKWNAKSLGLLLSGNEKFGPKAVELAASHLQQMLQDARNIKRNLKTGSRTPAWMLEMMEDLVVKDEVGDPTVGDASPTKGESGNPGHQPKGCSKLSIGESWTTGSHTDGTRRKRTLKLALSETSDEQPVKKKPLLAIEDWKTEEDENNIEDTSTEAFIHDWDVVSNKGKRMKLGGRWRICDRQEPDRASGFMKCYWKTDAGEQHWISEMTILEYESIDPSGIMKRPAASCQSGNPGQNAAMKRPAAATMPKKKLDSKVRKREHSKIYHQTLDKAIAAGNTKEVGKAKAREAAKKHIDKLISQL